MVVVIGAIVGFIVGAAFLDFGGAVLGAAAGYLLAKVSELTKTINKQQETLNLIQRTLQSGRQVFKQEENSQPDVAAPIEPQHNNTEDLKQPDSASVNIAEQGIETVAASEHTQTSEPIPKYQDHYNDMISRARESKAKDKTSSSAPSSSSQPLSSKEKTSHPFIQLIEQTSMMTKVGVVILFFGVAFLLKYASENVSLPIEIRLLGVVIGGFVLFFVGLRMKNSRPGFSVLLQGAAIGVLYLVTFSAMKMYSIISPSLGFFILFFLSCAAALLSVKQDAKPLAIFGILGGFLSPILASTGSGSHVMLFSYYAILNAGILSIVWFKAWRSLTLMGFVFTFVIGTIWGVTRYSADLFASTEPFLLLYFGFYVAVVMIFALRKQWAHNNVLDGPLVYGTPVIVFGLQSVLVEHFEYGLAWSSLAFGLFYLSIVTLRWRLFSERSILLRESFLAIGCIFVSLSIPFAFDYDVSALLWAVEGTGALWLALRQQRIWGCLLALTAQVGAGIFWVLDFPSSGDQLFFNAAYLTAAGISLVGIVAALLLRAQAKEPWTSRFQFNALSLMMLCWGLLWWFAAGLWQLEAHIHKDFSVSVTLIFITFSCFALQFLRKRFEWQELAPVLFMLLPASCFIAIVSGLFIDHPSENFGWIAWPMAIACLYWMYNKADIFIGRLKVFEKLWHGVTYLLIVILLSWEAWWQVSEVTYNLVWQNIGVGLVSLAAIWVVLRIRFWRLEQTSLYEETLVGILFLGLFLNFINSCFLVPDVSPLPYIPLLNPLDIWQVAIILSASYWWFNHFRETKYIPSIKVGWMIITVLVFGFLNTLLLRTLHTFADIPFHHHALFSSDLVQTCLSVFWSILGIGLFVLAKRLAKKEFWMLGVGLFSVVVIKLFIIDLANSGTVERIVSFIAVGLLLLGVGYIKPETALDKKSTV